MSITGVQCRRRMVKIALRGLRDRTGVSSAVYNFIVENGVDVEMLAFDASVGGVGAISLIIYPSQKSIFLMERNALLETVGGTDLVVDDKVALFAFETDEELMNNSLAVSEILDKFLEVGVNVELISLCSHHLSAVVRDYAVDKLAEHLSSSLGLQVTE